MFHGVVVVSRHVKAHTSTVTENMVEGIQTTPFIKGVFHDIQGEDGVTRGGWAHGRDVFRRTEGEIERTTVPTGFMQTAHEVGLEVNPEPGVAQGRKMPEKIPRKTPHIEDSSRRGTPLKQDVRDLPKLRPEGRGF